ncbi:hypothetical protein Bbelb_060600 [Branchiostoma belcheri]|nr:hypothetical protein Bbelb_060600 [Branchiostoma belcheri]
MAVPYTTLSSDCILPEMTDDTTNLSEFSEVGFRMCSCDMEGQITSSINTIDVTTSTWSEYSSNNTCWQLALTERLLLPDYGPLWVCTTLYPGAVTRRPGHPELIRRIRHPCKCTLSDKDRWKSAIPRNRRKRNTSIRGRCRSRTALTVKRCGVSVLVRSFDGI